MVWSSDEHAIAHWLGDFPYDDIVAAAGSFLGLEKLTQLAHKAPGVARVGLVAHIGRVVELEHNF